MKIKTKNKQEQAKKEKRVENKQEVYRRIGRTQLFVCEVYIHSLLDFMDECIMRGWGGCRVKHIDPTLKDEFLEGGRSDIFFCVFFFGNVFLIW